MKTSTAEKNNYRCPQCGDELTHDSAGRGFVRHRANKSCSFERGERDAIQATPSRRGLRALLLATFFSISTSAVAAPIVVPNFSFDDPARTTDGQSSATVPGWTFEGATGVSNFGVANPDDSMYSGSSGANAPLPGTALGSQTAYLDKTSGANAYLHSGPLITIAADTRYTLTIAVGFRKGYPFKPSGGVGLETNTTLIAQTVARPQDLVADTFLDFTTTFTTAATGDPLVGQQLGIRMTLSNGVQSSGQHLDFDNVRFDASFVPEPSCLALVVLSGIAFLFQRQRKRMA